MAEQRTVETLSRAGRRLAPPPRLKHALVVSPIPSDPPDQGNSARIGRFCELLQYHGYVVHFVYYGMEGLTPAQAAAMAARWDHFHFVPPSVSKQSTGTEGFAIDDFCGPEAGEMIARLQRTWRYDLAIVNYVWMSRVIPAIHPETLCAIDTHDLFGDRHHRLQQEGLAPTWFYCSPAEETKGLDRADLVLAIQPDEAAALAPRTVRPILTFGHVLPANFLPPPRAGGDRITVGYMASDNPSNRLALQALLQQVAQHPDVADRFEFVIAGRIGVRLPADTRGFRAVGVVRDCDTFYRSVEAVINPNVSGTGLKIKTVEALSYGLPIITTADGMCGIASTHPAHRCRDVAALVDALRAIGGREQLATLRAHSRSVFRVYADEHLAVFRALLAAADARRLAAGAGLRRA